MSHFTNIHIEILTKKARVRIKSEIVQERYGFIKTRMKEIWHLTRVNRIYI